MPLDFAKIAAQAADKPDPSVVARLEAEKAREEGTDVAAVQQEAEEPSVKAETSASSSSTAAKPTSGAAAAAAPAETSETPAPAPAPAPAAAAPDYRIKHLVLDASPLLTQAPIHTLHAQTVYIPPSVVAELKDPKARAHLQRLRELHGVRVSVVEPSPHSLVKVIAFAKQTGDYAVLSAPDLAVLALTYGLEAQEHGTWRIREALGGKTGQQIHEAERVERLRAEGKLPPPSESRSEAGSGSRNKGSGKGKQKEEQEQEPEQSTAATTPSAEAQQDEEEEEGFETVPIHPSRHLASEAGDNSDDDDDDDDSDAGEWINAENLQEHKNLALGIVTAESKLDKDHLAKIAAAEGAEREGSSTAAATAAAAPASTGGASAEKAADDWAVAGKSKPRKTRPGKGNGNSSQSGMAGKSAKPMSVACITSDYAVQNVMLQMGLQLISMSGQRITQVKSWVLRCHACMK